MTIGGFYLEDDMEGVHESLIQRYYGAYGPKVKRRRCQRRTGAGHIHGEDSGSESESDEPATKKPYHAAVKTPKVDSPFSEEQEHLFQVALERYLQDGALPPNVGEGWTWNPEAHIRVGRGTKVRNRRIVNPVVTPLPEATWKVRAVVWAKALRVMEECGLHL